MKLHLLPLLGLILSLYAASSTQAAVIAYDQFNYGANQTVAGLNGGSGFTSPWAIKYTSGAGTVLTSTAGITATPDHPTNPNGGGGIYAARSLPLINSGTVYLSFVMDNVNDNSRFIAFSPVYTTGAAASGSELNYIGQASGSSVWSIHTSSASVTDVTYPNGGSRTSRPNIPATHFVLKIEFDVDGLGQERLSLYQNPNLSTGEPVNPHVVAYTNYANGFNALWLGSGFSNGSQTTVSASFDNIIIATQWSDLATVPEPSRAFLAIAAIVLTIMRRQRR